MDINPSSKRIQLNASTTGMGRNSSVSSLYRPTVGSFSSLSDTSGNSTSNLAHLKQEDVYSRVFVPLYADGVTWG
jgi:hypothetical protein